MGQEYTFDMHRYKAVAPMEAKYPFAIHLCYAALQSNSRGQGRSEVILAASLTASLTSFRARISASILYWVC